jgi:hypothetical protein
MGECSRAPAVATTVAIALEVNAAGVGRNHSTEHSHSLCLLVRSWEDGGRAAWFSYDQSGNAFASLDLASIGDGAVKMTIIIETVFDEAAIGPSAINEAAIGESCTAKEAIYESYSR